MKEEITSGQNLPMCIHHLVIASTFPGLMSRDSGLKSRDEHHAKTGPGVAVFEGEA